LAGAKGKAMETKKATDLAIELVCALVFGLAVWKADVTVFAMDDEMARLWEVMLVCALVFS